MCVLTDTDCKVLGLYLIPGIEYIDPYRFIVWFPWVGDLPDVGCVLTQEQKEVQYIYNEALKNGVKI
jgi:hypothetical protein